ncbi:MAG TPA: DUF1800 domain-containing protein, partial [Candidatus Acidoferrales bacterium]|nr:DUF1800 domain-containing protein [Candidatus Acidoferrales bacterium]
VATMWAASARAPTVDKARKDRAPASARLPIAFKGRLPIVELSEEEATLHVLNRLGYGPRPGDIDRVRQMGLERWIDQQLNPQTIDDSALAARLGHYPSIAMSAAKLLDQYPTPEVAAKRMGITVEAYRKKLEETAKQRAAGMRVPPDMGPQQVVDQLAMAKLTRAMYSERQLEEQMTDFWFNHFNIFIYKDTDRYLVPSYERDTIRPYALGKFKDLLSATAHSPAMLVYLDNWLSADPRAFERIKHLTPQQRRMQASLPPLGGKRGLNENYGRELLELHTVGVDGGYTQKEVIEVARCFTGWTVRDPQKEPQFYFDIRLHDPDEKRVMGKKIHAGGIKDGEKVLEMLAKHPSTARLISLKLARRFVADNPPPALVASMAKTFLKTNADIRAVLRTMIYSPEFWSRQTFRAKVKTPFELVASTARALGSDVDAPLTLAQWTARIGEPLYQCMPPTGYADRAEAWVNTGALLNRLNFAIALASNRIRGTRVELPALVGTDATADPRAALDRAIDEFLAGQVSPETRTTLEQKSMDPQVLRAKLDDPVQQVDLGILTGLVLGSPEFQRR